MTIAVITGSAGLIGSEAALHFGRTHDVIGIDNDMRQVFFGPEASTRPNVDRLERALGGSYRHLDLDVRDSEGIDRVFADAGDQISLVVHTAAQPSHDWAAREPFTDFDVNARGTLAVLEATRRHASEATVIHCSTNKVYGDLPNSLPLVEEETRWEIESSHPYAQGITEDMSIDRSLHSIFGASKVAADIMVQEYGRYFGMNTACFRGGTLTGPHHAAAELHGFLAYVMRCAMTGAHYTVYGYQGKQVRDAIHSTDLINAFAAFAQVPRPAAVYNIGGGRTANCSVIEAIEIAQEIAGREMSWSYTETNRIGDHIWWVGSNRAFEDDHPGWSLTYDVPAILQEIHDANADHWVPS